MKPINLKALTFLLIIVGHCPSMASNFVVETGANIQSKVALAQPGDVVIARGGTYPEQNITVEEAIRLTREKDTTVRIGGSITYQDINSTVVLRDFEIDLNGNGRLVVSNCSRIGLENLTKLPQGLNISNSTVVIRDCNFTGVIALDANSTVEMVNSRCAGLDVNGSVFSSENSLLGSVSADTNSTLSLVDSNLTTGLFSGGSAFLRNTGASADVTFLRCDWEAHKSLFKGNLDSNESHSKLIRSTVEKAFRHNHEQALGQNLDCVVFQSTVGRVNGDVLLSKAHRTWLAYSELHHMYLEGGSQCHMVGNTVRNNLRHGFNSVTFDANESSFFASNNIFDSNNSLEEAVTVHDSSTYVGKMDYFDFNKTFTIPIQNINKVELAIRMAEDTGATNHYAKSKIDFLYWDGSSALSNEHATNRKAWQTKVYANPYPAKNVRKLRLFLSGYNHQNSPPGSTYHAPTYYGYAKDLKIFSSGSSLVVKSCLDASLLNNAFVNSEKHNYLIKFLSSPDKQSNILGNAFWRTANDWQVPAVSSPSGVICRNNYFQSQAQSTTGSLAHFDNVFGANPGFNDPASGDWTLSPTSILKNAGPAEAQYKDHDGTRNDIGLFGGHSYDANGTSTTKPVVLSADQSIRRIGLAENLPLIIKSRAAVSTP